MINSFGSIHHIFYWMNPCVNTERNYNESNNESEQIMILTHPIYFYLIIFLNSLFCLLKSDKGTHYESISETWA